MKMQRWIHEAPAIKVVPPSVLQPASLSPATVAVGDAL